MNSEKKKDQLINKEGWIISAILVIALVTRLFFFNAFQFAQPEVKYAPDSQSYIKTAEALVQRGVFGQINSSGEIEIETVRTPGYPVLIALTMLISPGAFSILVPVFQILLNTLAVFYLIKLTKRIFNFKIAVFTGVLFSLDFLSIAFSFKLLTESVFQSCLVLFLFFAVEYLLTLKPKQLIIAGLLLACMTFVRPIAYYFVFFISFGFFIYGLVVQKKKKHMAFFHTALFVTVAFVPVLLWQVRNTVHTGYSDFSSIASINIYEYNAASVLAMKEGISFLEKQRQHRMIKKQEMPTYPNPQAYYDHMKKEGLKIVKTNFSLFAYDHIKGMTRVLFTPSLGLLLRLDPCFDIWWKKQEAMLVRDKLLFLKGWLGWPHVAILSFIEYLIIFVSLIGIITFFCYRKLPFVIRTFLLGSFLYFFILSGGIVGYYRFRLALYPIFFIVTPPFIVNLITFFRSKRT